MAYEVTEGVYRLGANLVNWWIVEDKGKFTVIDAGTPNQYEQLPAALATLGRTMGDVEAIVLTHAHGDHMGSAARIKDVSRAPVHVHGADVELARGRARRQYERHYVRDLTRGFAWRSLLFFARSGATKPPPVHELVEFAHGETLDIPGRPVVIHTPGHTAGSSCLALPFREILFTGDALVTLSIVTGERTPRIMPGSFNDNSPAALESLNELRGSNARWIMPGHGEPWHGSVDAAIDLAHHTGAN
jgi:glyoxylase-like metal-dependent hydrolase (beta-lactamase superfamily II)